MARENRKDNRSKAKEASNANDETIETDEKSGFDISDLLVVDDLDEDDEPELPFKDASKSEKGSSTSTPKDVDKTGEEDEDGEEVYSALTAEAGKEGVEVPDEEKTPEVEQKPELPDETVPPTTEPTPPVEPKEPEKVIEVPAETLSDEKAAELFTNWRSTTEDLLAKHHYRLTEADVEAFNENPAEFIPRMASKVYLDSISAAFQQFVTYLPRMVDQVLVQREQGNANENMFFGKWPELKQHTEVVQRLGKAYRSQNPSASVEDFINEVGAQAMVALRKTPVAMAPNGNGHAVPDPQSAKPFKPASNGPANERIQPAKPQNQWDALASDFSGITEEELDDN